MQRLKNRNKQIPNGFTYRQAEIGWDSKRVLGLHPSFDTLTRSVMSARKANPHHAQKHKWALDFEGVALDVENYNVKVCLANGWTSYLTEPGGGAPPFSIAQSLQNQKQLGVAVSVVKKLWAGVKTLNAWLDSGEPPVAKELSEKRAAICASCNLNGKGDFSSWFTIPASGAIKRQLEVLTARQISTSIDEKLNVCTGCLCPLKVKVHAPMQFIKAELSPEVVAELRTGKSCWIISEMAA